MSRSNYRPNPSGTRNAVLRIHRGGQPVWRGKQQGDALALGTWAGRGAFTAERETGGPVLSVIRKRSFLMFWPVRRAPAISSAPKARSSVQSSLIRGMVIRCAAKLIRRRQMHRNLFSDRAIVVVPPVALCSLCGAVATAVSAIAAQPAARTLGGGSGAQPTVGISARSQAEWRTCFASGRIDRGAPIRA